MHQSSFSRFFFIYMEKSTFKVNGFKFRPRTCPDIKPWGDMHAWCRWFGSVNATTCFKDLALSQLGFEHWSFACEADDLRLIMILLCGSIFIWRKFKYVPTGDDDEILIMIRIFEKFKNDSPKLSKYDRIFAQSILVLHWFTKWMASFFYSWQDDSNIDQFIESSPPEPQGRWLLYVALGPLVIFIYLFCRYP